MATSSNQPEVSTEASSAIPGLVPLLVKENSSRALKKKPS
jgi:hypothetical protein